MVPSGATILMPRSGWAPAWSTVLSTPSLSRMREPSGERYSPQIFGRGKRALARSATAKPRSARRMAAAAPAGPAPTTTTSIVFTAGPSRLRPHGALADEPGVVHDADVKKPGLLTERGDFRRRVGAQHRQGPVVSRHRAPREQARDEPHEATARAAAHEIVHHPAEPRGGIDLAEVARRLLGLEVVERHRRDDHVHRPR